MKLTLIGVLALSFAYAVPQGAYADDALVLKKEDDALTHPLTGVAFPERVAGFDRRDTKEGQDPEDISVWYAKPMGTDGSIAIRIGLTRLESATPQDIYIVLRGLHMQRLEKSEAQSDGPYTPPIFTGASQAPGHMGEIQGRQNDVPVTMRLWVVSLDDWHFRFRVLFPSSVTKRATRDVDNFIRAFPWPSSFDATAARRVQVACANGLSLTVRYSEKADLARVEDQATGAIVTLRRQRSGSGPKYGDGAPMLSGKGEKLQWTDADGKITACSETP
jgi:membrane-bound inhibitor of C-type lysozyme